MLVVIMITMVMVVILVNKDDENLLVVDEEEEGVVGDKLGVDQGSRRSEPGNDVIPYFQLLVV